MDKGMNTRDIEGMFDVGGEFVDIVKFGWGTSYVTNNLEKKIALYRSFETPVVCGGTLFEVVYARGRMDEFKSWLQEHRFSHVEISDGTLDIPRDEKPELISDFCATSPCSPRWARRIPTSSTRRTSGWSGSRKRRKPAPGR
jgi:phosphosulfolactate synthase